MNKKKEELIELGFLLITLMPYDWNILIALILSLWCYKQYLEFYNSQGDHED